MYNIEFDIKAGKICYDVNALIGNKLTEINSIYGKLKNTPKIIKQIDKNILLILDFIANSLEKSNDNTNTSDNNDLNDTVETESIVEENNNVVSTNNNNEESKKEDNYFLIDINNVIKHPLQKSVYFKIPIKKNKDYKKEFDNFMSKKMIKRIKTLNIHQLSLLLDDVIKLKNSKNDNNLINKLKICERNLNNILDILRDNLEVHGKDILNETDFIEFQNEGNDIILIHN